MRPLRRLDFRFLMRRSYFFPFRLQNVVPLPRRALHPWTRPMGKQARKKGRPLRLTDLWSRQRPFSSSSSLQISALNTSVASSSSPSILVDSKSPQLSFSSAPTATEPPVLSSYVGSNDTLPACSLLVSPVDCNYNVSTTRPEGVLANPPSGIPSAPLASIAQLDLPSLAYANRAATQPHLPSSPTLPSPPPPLRHPAAARPPHSSTARAAHSLPACPDPLLGPNLPARTDQADPRPPLPQLPPGSTQHGDHRTPTVNPHHGSHRGPPTLSHPSHPDPPVKSTGKRPLLMHDFWCPDPEEDYPKKTHRTSSFEPPRPASSSPSARPSLSLSPPDGLPPAAAAPSADVQFLGPLGPPVLQAVSPSGDVRLTLRRYTPTDRLNSSNVLIRMDLRIQPRDLYTIPRDGHCGYHSLAVLSHPLFPSPPSLPERQELHAALLRRLLLLPHPSLRAAASAGLHHRPPRHLPQQHWLNSTWLHQIPDLPPIGCLAPLGDRDSQWYYCTALSCSPSQLEHSLDDLLRVADSGRLLLHSHAHYHPVSPPAFLSLATRQCSALLQRQLGGDDLPPVLPRLPAVTPPSPPRIRRYTTIRAYPGGLQLGLGPSSLSPEAQWGVFTLKTIPSGSRVLEYGGQHRSQAWLDTPGQNLIYVWSDLDNHVALQKTGQLPVIIDANPASTDSWGGRINDGLTQGANVEIRRDKHSDKVYIWALETLTPGTELTVHYGPDYWQEHFFHCPVAVQQDAAQCYSLVALEGKCFQTKELRHLRSTGEAHQRRGQWFLGPRPGSALPVSTQRPGRPLRPHSCPLLPLPEPSPTPPAPPHTPPPPHRLPTLATSTQSRLHLCIHRPLSPPAPRPLPRQKGPRKLPPFCGSWTYKDLLLTIRYKPRGASHPSPLWQISSATNITATWSPCFLGSPHMVHLPVFICIMRSRPLLSQARR